MIKRIITLAVALGAVVLLPSITNAVCIEETHIEEPVALGPKNIQKKIKKLKKELKSAEQKSLVFTAASLYEVEESGASYDPFFSEELNIPVILLPETDSPTATIGFKLPSHFKTDRPSKLSVQFITDNSKATEGNVTFNIIINETSPGDAIILTSTPITVGPFSVSGVKSTETAMAAANYYNVEIPLGKDFANKDFLYLQIVRDNVSYLPNYTGIAYVTSIELSYNL